MPFIGPDKLVAPVPPAGTVRVKGSVDMAIIGPGEPVELPKIVPEAELNDGANTVKLLLILPKAT